MFGHDMKILGIVSPSKNAAQKCAPNKNAAVTATALCANNLEILQVPILPGYCPSKPQNFDSQ